MCVLWGGRRWCVGKQKTADTPPLHTAPRVESLATARPAVRSGPEAAEPQFLFSIISNALDFTRSVSLPWFCHLLNYLLTLFYELLCPKHSPQLCESVRKRMSYPQLAPCCVIFLCFLVAAQCAVCAVRWLCGILVIAVKTISHGKAIFSGYISYILWGRKL